MPNPELAQLIASALKTGLPHPGRPETKEGPRKIPLVAFRTAGLPEEMREHVDNTALCCGEAIVNLIENQGRKRVILDREELDKLRADDADPDAGVPMPVVCRACNNPIVYLRVVNGRAMVAATLLGGANLQCPHTVEGPA